MNPMCNPTHKNGDRNVFCPHYGDCLDYAIQKTWEYWECSDCQHRLTVEARPEIQSKGDDIIEYLDLPLEIN